MDQEAFEQFLKDRYYPTLHHAQQRAVHHQRVAKGLEWALIVLSATTSILLAISSLIKVLPITPIVAVLSAIVTVIASLMKSLKSHEKFSFYRKLGNDLQNEYAMYDAQIGGYQKFADKEQLFVKRILSLLGKADQKMPERTLSDVLPTS
ncbi:MAG: DUF4231 domain-containing protein [Ktedonobacteraceae bacterium]